MPRLFRLLILACAVVHVAEEFILDWTSWTNQFIAGVTLTQFIFWNVLFLALCVAGVFSPSPILQLSLASLVVLNAFIHLAPSLVLWQYSPGLVSALVLYLPVGVSAYAVSYRRSLATRKEMFLSVPLGAAWMAAPLLYQVLCVFGSRGISP
jgi:hypothetical protein